MILICGATGTIGSRVTRYISDAAIPARALLRRSASDSSSLPHGVESVTGDLTRKETLMSALADVDKVFLLSSNGPQQAEAEGNLIAAAAESGVSHVVKLSVLGAAPDAQFQFGRIHGELEARLEKSGIAWTHIRPNMMMQNLRWYGAALSQGVLPMPLGDAAVSHVDADDIAAVVFKTLTEGEHAGRAYTLTGPEALTCADVASILSVALGREIQYQAISIADFRAFLLKSGESDLMADAECELFELWSHGSGAEVTTTIQEITKSRAKSLADFASLHARELA